MSFKKKKLFIYLMSLMGFPDISPYSSNESSRMPSGVISQPRLLTSTPSTKAMFNSPGLSLALVRHLLLLIAEPFLVIS